MKQGRPTVSGKTLLYGLLADPVDHLQTPAAFAELLDRRGFDATFIPLHVCSADLPAAVEGLRSIQNCLGFCVSIPHKTEVARLCDKLLPNAQACCAVNGVRFDNNRRLVGETFDGLGMVRAISRQRKLDKNTKVLLLGAGGVGSAIGIAMALEGIGRLMIWNRTERKANDLASAVRNVAPNCNVDSNFGFKFRDFDIVINATSLGLNGLGAPPVEVTRLAEHALVAEVIMKPEHTPFILAAQERGLDIVQGRKILTQQLETVADYLGITPLQNRSNGLGR